MSGQVVAEHDCGRAVDPAQGVIGYKVALVQSSIGPGSVSVQIDLETIDGAAVAADGIDGTNVSIPDGGISSDQDVLDAYRQEDAALATVMCG
jgi:hypothetical protein